MVGLIDTSEMREEEKGEDFKLRRYCRGISSKICRTIRRAIHGLYVLSPPKESPGERRILDDADPILSVLSKVYNSHM